MALYEKDHSDGARGQVQTQIQVNKLQLQGLKC